MVTCNVRRRRGLSAGGPRNSMSPEKSSHLDCEPTQLQFHQQLSMCAMACRAAAFRHAENSVRAVFQVNVWNCSNASEKKQRSLSAHLPPPVHHTQCESRGAP